MALKTKKITLSIVVTMNEETEQYYKEDEGELHTALIESNAATLIMEDSVGELSKEHWGAEEEGKEDLLNEPRKASRFNS
jgi:hypothetical protein